MSAELICAATDPAWLERRREGITATDIVTIAGLVTWDSPWALYHRKLGLLPEVEETWRMRRGSWLEEAIATEWIRSHPADEIRSGGLYRSEVRKWQMATPDRLVSCTPDGYCGGHATLDCKSTQVREGWGPDGTDQVPAHVRAQVLWQMDTLGVATGHVAADICGEFRSYTIRHDCPAVTNPAFVVLEACPICQEIDGLRDLGFGFWSRILTRRPPDLDGLEVTTDALRYLHPAPGGQVELSDLGADVLEKYDVILELSGEYNARAKSVKNEVRSLMGDAHEATVDGNVVFRRTIGKRAGYVVAPSETDTLRRIGKDKHDD